MLVWVSSVKGPLQDPPDFATAAAFVELTTKLRVGLRRPELHFDNWTCKQLLLGQAFVANQRIVIHLNIRDVESNAPVP